MISDHLLGKGADIQPFIEAVNQRGEPHSGVVCEAAVSLGTTSWRSSGLTEISPVKGRLYAAISSDDRAKPVAKRATAMAQVSRLSLWTIAIAMSAQSPISRIAAHFTGPTSD